MFTDWICFLPAIERALIDGERKIGKVATGSCSLFMLELQNKQANIADIIFNIMKLTANNAFILILYIKFVLGKNLNLSCLLNLSSATVSICSQFIICFAKFMVCFLSQSAIHYCVYRVFRYYLSESYTTTEISNSCYKKSSLRKPKAASRLSSFELFYSAIIRLNIKTAVNKWAKHTVV